MPNPIRIKSLSELKVVDVLDIGGTPKWAFNILREDGGFEFKSEPQGRRAFFSRTALLTQLEYSATLSRNGVPIELEEEK